jgi:2-iminobutanoate/2-iminopropanoate deaminase
MQPIRLLAMTVVLGACASSHAAAPPVEYVPAPMPGAPFSSAVVVGSMIYLSGQLGADSTGHLVPGGIRAETAQAIRNIAAILQAHGSSLDRVVKCTAMLADIQEWPALNEVYTTFFKSHLPARSAFATAGLVRGARIELECTAVR